MHFQSPCDVAVHIRVRFRGVCISKPGLDGFVLTSIFKTT